MDISTKKDLSYRISKMRSEIRNKIAEDNEILRIMQLINRLELQTFVCSSSTAACYYPEYKQLVKMGKKLIPLIYEFLKDDKTAHWWMFTLLSEITGCEVATPQMAGKFTMIRKAWLKWFKENNKETFNMLPNAEVAPPQKLSTLFASQQTLIAYTEDAAEKVVKMFEDLSRQANVNAKCNTISLPLNSQNCESADRFIEFVTAVSTTGTLYKCFLFSGFEHILDNFSLKDAVRCIEFVMRECNARLSLRVISK